MHRGKMVAQRCHASREAVLSPATRESNRRALPLDRRVDVWLGGSCKEVCLFVDSEATLLNVFAQARAGGLITSLIPDARITEFKGVPTYTAWAGSGST